MSMRTFNLDDKKEYDEYKKKRKHEKFKKENPPEVKVEPTYEVPEEPDVDPEKEITSTQLLGKVTGIDQLRVRNYPEGDVIKLIKRDTEVEIISEHDDIWYKVLLNDGTIGFCMKEFLLTYVNGSYEIDQNDPRRCKTCPIQ